VLLKIEILPEYFLVDSDCGLNRSKGSKTPIVCFLGVDSGARRDKASDSLCSGDDEMEGKRGSRKD